MRFGKQQTDALETYLFGVVDKKGAAATEFFSTYTDYKDGIHEHYQDLLLYIGAQRFRTPHGLDWIKKHVGAVDHTQTLMMMHSLFQAYGTMWMEGVWELAHAHDSRAKFIISDGPVTFFNKRNIPGGLPYPGIDDFPRVGTRTVFPLGPECCLIITHLQLARDPWHNPMEKRQNARSFQQTLAKFTDIQFGRELTEGEVLKINHILKRSARKFIAAPTEDALYPERGIGDVHWTKLDDDWFLLPNLWKVPFTTGIMMGFNDGTAWGMDEYGRNPGHPLYQDEATRAFERRRSEKGKREWAKRRIGKSLSMVIDEMRENTASDSIINDYLRTMPSKQ